MSIADAIIIAVLLAILTVIVHATRPRKGRGSDCGSCHSDYSNCSAFFSLYEDYKKNQEQG